MADMKTLNTRIKLKYDLHTEWMKPENDPVLLAGEIAIAKVETAQTDPNTGVVNYVPSILMKVGDGEHKYSELGFTYARSADVADWAKADTLQASAVQGLGDYIANYVDETLGISVDTNTVYRLYTEDNKTYKLQSKAAGEADTAYADVAGSAFTIDLTNVNEGVAALKALHATNADGSMKGVSTEISEAISGLKLGDTYAEKEHTHTKSEITDFAHTHTKSEITDFAHTHEISEVNGLSNAIEAATKAGTDAAGALDAYKLTNNQAVGGNAAAIEAITKDASIKTLKGIEDKIGTVTEGKTVAEMIEAAQTAATYDDKAVKDDIADLKALHADGEDGKKKSVSAEISAAITGLDLANTYAAKGTYETYVAANDKAVAANTAAIELLNKDDQTEGSVDYKIAQEVAKILNDNDASDIDTLNEIAAWITNDINGVGGLVADVTENTNAIKNIKDGVALDSFKDVEDKIGTLTESTVAAEIAAAKEDAIKTATYDDSGVTGRLTALEGLHGADENGNKKAVSVEISEAITGLDLANTYAAKSLEGTVGDLSNKVDTLKIEDLGQAANTYIVFDCGTASTII